MEKLRKYRIVVDRCPLKKNDCNKCRYYNGHDLKVYCYYGDENW